MEIYGGGQTKAFTASHIVWPILAACLAGTLYLYLAGSITSSPIVDNTVPVDTGALHKQFIVANVLSAFDTATTTVEAPAPVLEIVETTPAPVTAAPVLTAQPSPMELTKTSRKTALPKIVVPKFTITLATSSASVSTTIATTTPSVKTVATSTAIQQLYEVKIPGGGGGSGGGVVVVSSGGGGGGGSSPAPAPVPDPVVLPPAPVLTVPDAPTLVSATAGNATTTVVWTAPSNSGNTGLTDYEIRQSTDNFASNNTVVNDGVGTSSTSYLVTGLVNGTQYYFKISAINSVGTSTASNVMSATPVAPAPSITTPGAPTNVQFAAGDASFDLAWTAPASDGGSAITDYEVHYSTSTDFSTNDSTFAHSASTATSSTVDSGISNGVPYYVRIKAVNAGGAGAASAIAGPIVPVGVGSSI